jgi:hypothetical protein
LGKLRTLFTHPTGRKLWELTSLGALVAVLAGFLVPQSFSPFIYIAAVALIVGLFILLVIITPLTDNHNEGKFTPRRKGSGLVVLALVLVTAVIGFRQWRKEPAGGTLAIYVPAGTSAPNQVTIHRGFPKWLAILDRPITVDFDPQHRKFSVPSLQCGKWYIDPQPQSEYKRIGPVTIPSTGPRKAILAEPFQKHRCTFSLRTSDQSGAPLEGASIQLKPDPQVGNPVSTPDLISLEVGYYDVAFSLEGYAPSQPTRHLCFPDAEVEVSAKLMPQANRGAGSSEDSAQKPKTVLRPPRPTPSASEEKSDIRPTLPQKPPSRVVSPPPAEIIAIGSEEAAKTLRNKELINVSRLVSKLLSTGNHAEAIEHLEVFRHKYPGTREAEEAEELIRQIIHGREKP